MDWEKHLKPVEIARMSELSDMRKQAIKERKRIVDRCRMRAKRKEEKCSD